MTEQDAIALADSSFYESVPASAMAIAQAFSERLMMPQEDFINALTYVLAREVTDYDVYNNLPEIKKELVKKIQSSFATHTLSTGSKMYRYYTKELFVALTVSEFEYTGFIGIDVPEVYNGCVEFVGSFTDFVSHTVH